MRALCCEKASGAIGRGAFAWLPSTLCPTLVSVSRSHTRWQRGAEGAVVVPHTRAWRAPCPMPHSRLSVSLAHEVAARGAGDAVAVCPYDAAAERVAERAAARTAERCDRAPLSVTHSLSMLSLTPTRPAPRCAKPSAQSVSSSP